MAAYLPMIMQGAQSQSGIQASIAGYYSNKNNAKAATYEGQSAMAAAQAKSDLIARNNRLLTERQFAGFAGSGVDATQGSPLDVMTQDAVQGELDALMAQYEGRVAQQASNYEAKQYKYQAKQNKIAGAFQAVFDPAGMLIKLPQVTRAPKAPTIQPGGGASSSFEQGYNAPDLKASDIFR